MKKPDIFDPSKKYVFTNWSTEAWEYKYANPDFQFIPPPNADDYTQKEIKRMWEAAYKKDYYRTIRVPAGGVVEVPEWLAFLMTKHFVDREYVKAVEGKHGSMARSANGGKPNEQAESEMLTMHSSSFRDELEDKTIRLISSTEESPVLAALREQIRQEERAKLIKKGETELEIQAIEAKPTIKKEEEFAGLNTDNETTLNQGSAK